MKRTSETQNIRAFPGVFFQKVACLFLKGHPNFPNTTTGNQVETVAESRTHTGME
jgi:hypothetical protein